MKFISPPSKGASLTFKCKVGITVIWLLLGAVLGYLFLNYCDSACTIIMHQS